MRSLLVSTYEMGRQPFGIASAAAWLRAAGWTVACVDVAKETLREKSLTSADLIAFHLPMHTATRLAAPIIAFARRVNPAARLCAFGLYAPLNAEWLRSLGVDEIFGGEFEDELTEWAGLKACATSSTSDDQPQSSLSTHGQACSAVSALVEGSSFDKLRTSAVDKLRTSEPPLVTTSPFDRSAQTPLVVSLPALSAANGSNHERLPRIHFLVPDRSGLPPLSQYATLQLPDGRRRLAGYTEASRGCRHLCRHCPVVPIYNGQFRVVQADVVLADVAAQVEAGAQHLTFGDPDFFNGPTHAIRLVDAVHAAYPALTYDVTIKVEHLRRHRRLLPRLTATGCAFVTSAVESLDDQVLALFDKGHTRADFVEVLTLCRDAGVTLVPTFVAFHPWLTLETYCDLLDTIARLDLVDHVAPIQLAIRLLIPEGSRLLALDEIRPLVHRFDPATLTYRWTHPDPRVDALQREVSSIVGTRLTADRRALFAEISALAHDRAGLERPSARPARQRATVPYLNEPWYC